MGDSPADEEAFPDPITLPSFKRLLDLSLGTFQEQMITEMAAIRRSIQALDKQVSKVSTDVSAIKELTNAFALSASSSVVLRKGQTSYVQAQIRTIVFFLPSDLQSSVGNNSISMFIESSFRIG